MASIALVEPQPSGFHVYSAFRLPRLGLPSLGAILRKLGHQVQIYVQGFGRFRERDVLEADVVGISTTTSTAPEAYRLADLCRAAGKPVIMGGVHATFCAEEALQHADYVVRGEAEDVIGDLIERALGRQPAADLPGVITASGAGPESLPALCRLADLDAAPFPDLSLISNWRPSDITPIMTSRGCPFNCKFCSVTPMFGRRYRFRSSESVLDELRAKNPHKVFFYDDNFAANETRTAELLEQMLSANVKPYWSAQVRADVTRNRDLLKLFRQSGCGRVYVGFESVNPATLEEYHKNQSVEEVVESMHLFHEHGIKVHGMFVLGSDHDDLQTVRETARFARRHGIDTVQFMVLTPLPGTPTFSLLERARRLFDRDWSLYDGQHVVFQPMKMTAAALQREVLKAYKRFYSWWDCVKAFGRFHWNEGLLNTYARYIIERWETHNAGFLQYLNRREKAAD